MKEGDILYLSQPGHIDKIIAAADISHITKDVNAPMDPTFNDKDQDTAPPCNRSKYSALLGMLIYVLRTRPDISYSVNRLAIRSSVSTAKDWHALQRVAAYLRTTSHLELIHNTSNVQQRTTVDQLHERGDSSL